MLWRPLRGGYLVSAAQLVRSQCRAATEWLHLRVDFIEVHTDDPFSIAITDDSPVSNHLVNGPGGDTEMIRGGFDACPSSRRLGYSVIQLHAPKVSAIQ
jgi:hypothetical protein